LIKNWVYPSTIAEINKNAITNVDEETYEKAKNIFNCICEYIDDFKCKDSEDFIDNLKDNFWEEMFEEFKINEPVMVLDKNAKYVISK